MPVLETPSGCIFESNAIARYVARIRRDTDLTGVSFFESGQVDSWIDFASHDLELPATLWYYPVLGYIPANPAVTARAKTDFARALNVLEAHLADKTYLVGHKITLADITVVSALVYPFKFVADAAYRAAFPNVMRWFTTCVNQPQFEAVIGAVVLCEKELAASGAASSDKKQEKKEKKEKKPKEPKEAKPKEEKKPKEAPKPKEQPEEDFEEVKEKKEEHPFKLLDKSNPSPFVMDTWKKTYSNCEGDYASAMATFWETFDAAGYSLWRGDYNYDNENTVLFMTSNLIGGFIQRTEEIRKWLFGTITIRGEAGRAGGMKVSCYFLIRGQEIQPLIDCNPDAEYYTWTKMAIPPSDADKQTLAEFWTSETTILGEPVLDSRCYK